MTKRIDTEGRDVTNLPGLWDESDRHYFECVDCGKEFQGCEPPAETDPKNPQCDTCICKMLDTIDVVPMTSDEIDRIVRFVVDAG